MGLNTGMLQEMLFPAPAQSMFQNTKADLADFPRIRFCTVALIEIGLFHSFDGGDRVGHGQAGVSPGTNGRAEGTERAGPALQEIAEQDPIQLAQDQPLGTARRAQQQGEQAG